MRTLSTLFLVALGTLCLMAQTGPKLTVDKRTHNFGDIDRGDKVTTEFNFKNDGDQPLEIISVSTSCGCTSAKPEKTLYAPGESGVIPVTFNSDRFSGNITKRVTIATNDKAAPKTVVTISGNVITEISASPENLLFPKARIGEQTTMEVLVSTTKLEKLELKDINVGPEFLSAKMERVDDKNVKILVTADGNKFPPGKTRLNGSLSYGTNSKTSEYVKSVVTLNVQHPIEAKPQAVFLYASRFGKERTFQVNLNSSMVDKLELSDLKTDLEFVRAELVESNEKISRILVTLSDKAPVGKFRGALTMSTNVAAQEKLSIPINGSVVK